MEVAPRVWFPGPFCIVSELEADAGADGARSQACIDTACYSPAQVISRAEVRVEIFATHQDVVGHRVFEAGAGSPTGVGLALGEIERAGRHIE